MSFDIVLGYRNQPQPKEPVTVSELAIIGIVSVFVLGLTLLSWELGLSLQAAGLI